MKKFFYVTVLFLLFVSVHYSQIIWQKHGSPVLDLGTFPSWDDGYIGFGSVIHQEGIYKMWYSGSRSDFAFQIGYATSVDGTTWTKHTGNPVLSFGDPGSFDQGALWGPAVIYDFDESIYKMWYSASSPTTLDFWRIGYATSSDGINWTKHPTFVIDVGSQEEWDDFHIAMPSVIKEGSIYKMWYHGGRSYQTGRIGYATSPDGINWTKYDDPQTTNTPYAESDPVVQTGSPGEWDANVVWQPNVIYNDILSGYEMWFVAQGNFPLQNMGYAFSIDGINWTKYDNPITQNPPFAESDTVMIGTSGSFDRSLLAPCVIFDNNMYKMWYTGNDLPTWRIGYATADLTVPVELESFSALTIGSNINLTWVTATELNNHGFELFRNGNKIAFVEGKGTTTEKQEYFYDDKNLKDGIYNYRLEQIDFDGTRSIISSEITVHLTIPEIFKLKQNYPNPFNPSTTISWQSPVAGHHVLKVFDVLGREVATLVDEYKPAGSYEVEFDGNNLSSGIYLYKLTAGEYTAARKLVLLK